VGAEDTIQAVAVRSYIAQRYSRMSVWPSSANLLSPLSITDICDLLAESSQIEHTEDARSVMPDLQLPGV